MEFSSDLAVMIISLLLPAVASALDTAFMIPLELNVAPLTVATFVS